MSGRTQLIKLFNELIPLGLKLQEWLTLIILKILFLGVSKSPKWKLLTSVPSSRVLHPHLNQLQSLIQIALIIMNNNLRLFPFNCTTHFRLPLLMCPESINVWRIRFNHLLDLNTLKNELHGLLGVAIIAGFSLAIFSSSGRWLVVRYEELEHGFETTEGFAHGTSHLLAVLKLKFSLVDF